MTGQDRLEDKLENTEFSPNMIQALAHAFFPLIDSQLRAGKHIGQDDFEAYSYLTAYQDDLAQFYARYRVELICAPEAFFYLRPRASTLIARSVLSQLEMLVGKVLCSLYLSPERLAQEGIFSLTDLYEELMTLAKPNQLLKLINTRSTGSDLDKQKLYEKVKTALNRLRRMGMITFLKQNEERFLIHEAVFRFASEIRQTDQQAALRQLIQNGEAILTEVVSEVTDSEVELETSNSELITSEDENKDKTDDRHPEFTFGDPFDQPIENQDSNYEDIK